MAFWSAGLEPKRSNRWFLSISGEGMSNLQYAIKKTDKPSMKVNEVFHQYLNHKFYYPGRVEWNPISITLASVKSADEDATALIHAITVNSGYTFPARAGTSPDGNNLTTTSKNAFGTNLGKIEIVQINSIGNPIEVWKLNNPMFTDVKFASGLNYENDEIVEISFSLEYDWAELNPDSSSYRVNITDKNTQAI